ncbi:hypothetical protein QR685DRAFT_511303 [Neurospora intermedia]|uniref:Uncharacterized protein n=1 Tax=Neurospora intermedia TaxID=5142 RepID=A0ABR3DSY0_NEUIN
MSVFTSMRARTSTCILHISVSFGLHLLQSAASFYYLGTVVISVPVAVYPPSLTFDSTPSYLPSSIRSPRPA